MKPRIAAGPLLLVLLAAGHADRSPHAATPDATPFAPQTSPAPAARRLASVASSSDHESAQLYPQDRIGLSEQIAKIIAHAAGAGVVELKGEGPSAPPASGKEMPEGATRSADQQPTASGVGVVKDPARADIGPTSPKEGQGEAGSVSAPVLPWKPAVASGAAPPADPRQVEWVQARRSIICIEEISQAAPPEAPAAEMGDPDLVSPESVRKEEVDRLIATGFGPEAVVALRAAGEDFLGLRPVPAAEGGVFGDALVACPLIDRTVALIAALRRSPADPVSLSEWDAFQSALTAEPEGVRTELTLELAALLLIEELPDMLPFLMPEDAAISPTGDRSGRLETIQAYLLHARGERKEALERLITLAGGRGEAGALAAISFARLVTPSEFGMSAPGWLRHLDLLGAVALERSGSPLGQAAALAEARLAAKLFGPAAGVHALALAAARGLVGHSALEVAAKAVLAEAADRDEAGQIVSLPVWYLHSPGDFAAMDEDWWRDRLVGLARLGEFDPGLFGGDPVAGGDRGLPVAIPTVPEAAGPANGRPASGPKEAVLPAAGEPSARAAIPDWRERVSDAVDAPAPGVPAMPANRSGENSEPADRTNGSHVRPTDAAPELVEEILTFIAETDRDIEEMRRRLTDE